MFDSKALFAVNASESDEDTLFEVVLEAGADDVESLPDGFQVAGPPGSFQAISDALEAASIETQNAEITRVPQNTVELDVKGGRRVIKLLDVLEENDDIQNVTANFSIPDDIMQEVMAD